MTAKKKAPRKRQPKVAKKVVATRSVREFERALVSNLDEAYHELAAPVLSGQMESFAAYKFVTGQLEGLRLAGAQARATMLEDEDEQGDQNHG